MNMCLKLYLPLVIYLHNIQKKKQDKFKKNFINLTIERHLKVTESESWNLHNFIAIDKRSKKLFYLKKQKDYEETVLIDLTEVKKCRISNVSRFVTAHKGSESVIDKLNLVFTFNHTTLSEKIINFYDGEEGAPLRDELIMIEKWKNIINKLISM